MTDPIQFTTTADGLRIAYCVRGTGRAIVHMAPMPLRHVELEWQLPEDRGWLLRLGRQRKLVRYDPRGLGLSERRVDAISLDAFVLDLAAVIEAVGDGAVALFACLNTAPVAIRYALRHPERVSHLVLWCPVARIADSIAPQIGTLLDVADKDWELFTEAAAHVMVGWSKGDAAHRYADYFRACVTPGFLRSLMAEPAQEDVTEEMQGVRAPTLVLQRRDVRSVPVAQATQISARIPGAQLAILDGDVLRPGVGDRESAALLVDAFLGDVAPLQESVDPTPRDAPAPFVFRREGDYWTLIFEGQIARVRDSKGLHHIARLLRDPDSDIPASELIGHAGGAGAASLGDAGPVLDQKAKDDYKRRIDELRSELEHAAHANDLALAARARTELEMIEDQVSAAVGLGGRDRRASSAAERARLTVTKRIKDAITRIRTGHPSLARHLASSIRTGHLCAYRPEPGPPLPWAF